MRDSEIVNCWPTIALLAGLRVGGGVLALSEIASDDCHVTTETQLEEEELGVLLWREGGCSNHKKAAGSEESRFYALKCPTGEFENCHILVAH